MLTPDAVIIGAGPAGLSAAVALKQAGLADVRVIEREQTAGGIPRHCGHTGYGWREFRRVLTGPAYAHRLVAAAERAGALIQTGTAVTAIADDLTLRLAGLGGPSEMQPRRVIIATGNRERPRSARLIGGDHPLTGVMNTGELQQRIYLKGERPFASPIIIGAELVSFSALLTLRHAGIKPTAMIAPRGALPAPFGTDLAARALFGLEILRGTVTTITGTGTVSSITVQTEAGLRVIPCDGAIISGEFTPETQLLSGVTALEPLRGTPEVDMFFRTDRPGLFAAGNLLHPVETAGSCWQDGRAAAAALLADLSGKLPPRGDAVTVTATGPVKQLWPQRIARSGGSVYLRLSGKIRGSAEIFDITGALRHTHRVTGRPEQKIRLNLPAQALAGADRISIRVTENP